MAIRSFETLKEVQIKLPPSYWKVRPSFWLSIALKQCRKFNKRFVSLFVYANNNDDDNNNNNNNNNININENTKNNI